MNRARPTGMFWRRHSQGVFRPDGVYLGEPGDPLPEVPPADEDRELTTVRDLANHDIDALLEALGRSLASIQRHTRG